MTALPCTPSTWRSPAGIRRPGFPRRIPAARDRQIPWPSARPDRRDCYLLLAAIESFAFASAARPHVTRSMPTRRNHVWLRFSSIECEAIPVSSPQPPANPRMPKGLILFSGRHYANVAVNTAVRGDFPEGASRCNYVHRIAQRRIIPALLPGALQSLKSGLCLGSAPSRAGVTVFPIPRKPLNLALPGALIAPCCSRHLLPPRTASAT